MIEVMLIIILLPFAILFGGLILLVILGLIINFIEFLIKHDPPNDDMPWSRWNSKIF